MYWFISPSTAASNTTISSFFNDIDSISILNFITKLMRVFVFNTIAIYYFARFSLETLHKADFSSTYFL